MKRILTGFTGDQWRYNCYSLIEKLHSYSKIESDIGGAVRLYRFMHSLCRQEKPCDVETKKKKRKKNEIIQIKPYITALRGPGKIDKYLDINKLTAP